MVIEGLKITTGDLEPGDKLGVVKFFLPTDAHGHFYLNYGKTDQKELSVHNDGHSKPFVEMTAAEAEHAFTLSTPVAGSEHVEAKNVFTLNHGALTFLPDHDYSGYNSKVGVSDTPQANKARTVNIGVQATIVDADGQLTLHGKTHDRTMRINIEGVADKPDWERGKENQTYYHTHENDDHDNGVPLHIAAESSDNRDGSETIAYTLTIEPGTDGVLSDKLNGVLVLSPDASGHLKDDGINAKGEHVYTYTPDDNNNGKGLIDGDVIFKPNDYFSGGVNIHVSAQTTEKNDWAIGHHVSAENTEIITLGIDPIADSTHMYVEPLYKGTEDTAINLKNLVTLTETSDQKHGDGSETKYIRIFGLPLGDPNPATITINGKELAVSGSQDGKPYYEIPYKDVIAGNVLIHPVPQSNVPFDIKIEGIVKDVASVPQAAGTMDNNGHIIGEDAKTITSVYKTSEQTLHIDLKGVPDTPALFPNPDHLSHPDWTEGKIAVGDQLPTLIHTAVNENTLDAPSSVKLNFGLQSGEDYHPKDPSQNAALTDNSETLTVIISGIPEGATLKDAAGSVLPMTYAGKDPITGQPIYEVKLVGPNGQPDDHHVSILSGIELIPPLFSTHDIHLTTRVVVTENDGASKTFIGALDIPIVPIIDATLPEKPSTGLEDERTMINWMPTIPEGDQGKHYETLADGTKVLVDLGEHVTGLTLSDIPDGYRIYHDGVLLTPNAQGQIIFKDLSSEEVVKLEHSLTIQGPENSNGNISIKSTVTMSETDVDTKHETVTKELHETLQIHIQAQVEDQEPINNKDVLDNDHLVYIDSINGHDKPTKIDVTGLTSKTDTIQLHVNDTDDPLHPYQAGEINWLNKDTSEIFSSGDKSSASVEQIQRVVLIFENMNGTALSKDEADTLVVHGGINNGNGSWTVPESELSKLSITSSIKQEIKVDIAALVQDLGDKHQDPSNQVVRHLDNFTLTFEQGNSTLKAANITVDDRIVTGTESGGIGKDGESITSPTIVDLGKQLESSTTIASLNHANDELSLVINNKDLPAGVAIHGMHYNYETQQWVEKVSVTDGHPDLSGITMTLPRDYAGTFHLPITYVNTDSVSGDTRQVEVDVPVNINLTPDAPTTTGIIVETEGLGKSDYPDLGSGKYPEPVTEDNPEVIHKGIGYENGKIILDVDVKPTDRGSLDTGIEKVKEATLTVDPKDGYFVNAQGDSVQTITVNGADLGHVAFYPATNFSGDVNIHVSSILIDTARHTDSITTTASTDAGALAPDQGHDHQYTTGDQDNKHVVTISTDQKITEITDENSKPFESNIKIHVTAVDSGVTFTDNGKPIHSDKEDFKPTLTVSGEESILGGSNPTEHSISLGSIGGVLNDKDSSESILSVKLEGVPNGFTVEGAANNGHGVWTISVPQGAESFNFNDVKINPPRDFSGHVDIGVTVYSNEKALPLSDVRQDHATIRVNVMPVADGTSNNVTTSLTGTENQTVTMPLNIKVFDDKNSVTPADLFPNSSTLISPDNIHENAPERVQVILSNVPEGATFTLPEGVKGSVEKMANGDWKVITDATSLKDLEFHPGDANTENWDYGKSDHNTLHLQINALDADNKINQALTVTKDVTIDLTPVNDAPTVDVPTSPIDGDEGKNIAITGLSVHDIDVEHAPLAEKVPVTVTLTAEHGDIHVASGDGVTIEHNNSGKVILMGTIADIDKVLESDKGVTYKGDTYYNGTDKVTLSIDDNDNGALHPNKADGLTASGSVTVNVDPENNAPVNHVPSSTTTEEDKPVSITGLSISDPDVVAHDGSHSNAQSVANAEAAAKVDVSVTLSVEHGLLTLGSATGVHIDGQGSDKVVLTGTIADIDALLKQTNGVQYVGDKYYNGTDHLTMATNDNDNGGGGHALSATNIIPITVEAVNHAPVNAPVETQTTDEDQAHVIHGLQISDVDDSDNPAHDYTVTFSTLHGDATVNDKLAAEENVILTHNSAGGLVLNGTLDDINALLDSGVTYQGDKDFAGKDELTMITSDNGDHGIGGVKTDTTKVGINVRPVADVPMLSLNTPQTYNIRSAMSTLIPLLGFMAAVADAKDHLSIQLKGLGNATLVDANGDVVGESLSNFLGNGTWQINADNLKDVYIKGLSEGSHDVTVQSVSTISSVDGVNPDPLKTQALSKPVTIHIQVDDLDKTNHIIGTSAPSNGDDLIISDHPHSTLVGGHGNDILVGGNGPDILIGGAGDDILWGGTMNGHDSHGDIFVWRNGDLGTATAPAHDTIMDFDVASDKVDLTSAIPMQPNESLETLSGQLKITEDSQHNAALNIYQHGELVQTIDFHGINEHSLLGLSQNQSVNDLTNEHKISLLLSHGILELGEQFGDSGDNHLLSASDGHSLLGLGGDDILEAHSGNDVMAGGMGHDVFLWTEDSVSQNNLDTVKDFHVHQDALNITDLLPDTTPHANDLDRLLTSVHATVDKQDNVHLTIDTKQGTEQHITLDHMDTHALDLHFDSSSHDIVTHLYDHQVFQFTQDH